MSKNGQKTDEISVKCGKMGRKPTKLVGNAEKRTENRRNWLEMWKSGQKTAEIGGNVRELGGKCGKPLTSSRRRRLH